MCSCLVTGNWHACGAIAVRLNCPLIYEGQAAPLVSRVYVFWSIVHNIDLCFFSFDSDLQHANVPILQVYREQRRSEASAEGPRP